MKRSWEYVKFFAPQRVGVIVAEHYEAISRVYTWTSLGVLAGALLVDSSRTLSFQFAFLALTFASIWFTLRGGRISQRIQDMERELHVLKHVNACLQSQVDLEGAVFKKVEL